MGKYNLIQNYNKGGKIYNYIDNVIFEYILINTGGKKMFSKNNKNIETEGLSLSFKLIGIFLIIGLIPLISVSFLSLNNAHDGFSEEAFNKLKSVKEIKKLSSKQKNLADEVAQMMEKIASISQESTAGIQEISANTQEQKDYVDKIYQEIDNLSEQTEKLNKETNYFMSGFELTSDKKKLISDSVELLKSVSKNNLLSDNQKTRKYLKEIEDNEVFIYKDNEFRPKGSE